MDDEQGRAVDRAADVLVMGAVFPAWLLAGVLDWYWHRLTRIERSAGVPESVMHLLMGAQGGAVFTVAVFFEPSVPTVAAALGAAIVHHATALADILYTKPKRTIIEAENQTHCFLVVLPYVIAGTLAIRRSTEAFAIRKRKNMPHVAAIVATYAAAVAFGFVPHVEELARCIAARRA